MTPLYPSGPAPQQSPCGDGASGDAFPRVMWRRVVQSADNIVDAFKRPDPATGERTLTQPERRELRRIMRRAAAAQRFAGEPVIGLSTNDLAKRCGISGTDAARFRFYLESLGFLRLHEAGYVIAGRGCPNRYWVDFDAILDAAAARYGDGPSVRFDRWHDEWCDLLEGAEVVS